MSKRLFGTDGIRAPAGAYPLDAPTVTRIGEALAVVLGGSGDPVSVVTGRDTRESGPGIEEQLARGLRARGARVVSAGVSTTPEVAHCVRSDGFSAGIAISASHNPYADNGIKIFTSSGYKLSDEVEREIERLVLDGELDAAAGSEDAELPTSDAALGEHYVDHLLQVLPRPRALEGLTLVLDAAHGAAYKLAPLVFERAGARVLSLGDSPDGRNINLDCGALHPERLAAEVVRQDAQLGAAFDGDADRVIFADEEGNVRDGDDALAVLAPWLQRQGRLGTPEVVGTVMTNIALEERLGRDGISLVRTAVGDKYVLEELLRRGARLGGEPSGHLIFTEHATTGDGILSALMLAGVMASEERTLGELTHGFVKAPQILRNVRVSRRADLATLPDWVAAAGEVERAFAGRGRLIVRFSGTEPLLRIMLEGPDRAEVEHHVAELESLAHHLLDR